MYFNQSATSTVTHLSTPNYSQKKKKKEDSNKSIPTQKKKLPNPPLNINLRLPEQIRRERIEEEKKIRPWLKPSIEKLRRRR